jgi:hypothetical protein
MKCFVFLLFSVSFQETVAQEFPYPIHFDLPKSHLHEVTNFDLTKDVHPPAGKQFRVAVLTAGSIRSFAYVEKSWKRYLIEPWKKSLSIFAHAIGLPHCQISKVGLELLHDICTEYEISYSQAALLPYHEIVPRIPGYYYRFKEYMAQFSPTMSRGNYFDMHARRHRVYEMAANYALRNGFEWDLVMFLRLDIAFYAPRLELWQWYSLLQNYNNGTTKGSTELARGTEKEKRTIHSQPGVLIPNSCNFHGVCDRIAIGLPAQMAIYFKKDFVFEVLDWTVDEVPETHQLYYPKSYMRSNGNSEHILECWFLMNNLTQLFFAKPQPLVFVTVRSVHASSYCALSRDDYVKHYPTYDFIFDPDKTTANSDLTRPASDLDLISSSEQRCGGRMSHLNSTLACMHSGCQCGSWGRRRSRRRR